MLRNFWGKASKHLKNISKYNVNLFEILLKYFNLHQSFDNSTAEFLQKHIVLMTLNTCKSFEHSLKCSRKLSFSHNMLTLGNFVSICFSLALNGSS
jgi:hypothetical protein